MEKKQIDWENLGFGYVQTEQRYVSNYKDGKWDEGGLTEDAGVVLNECAGVLQYAQTVFEEQLLFLFEFQKKRNPPRFFRDTVFLLHVSSLF